MPLSIRSHGKSPAFCRLALETVPGSGGRRTPGASAFELRSDTENIEALGLPARKESRAVLRRPGAFCPSHPHKSHEPAVWRTQGPSLGHPDLAIHTYRYLVLGSLVWVAVAEA